MVIARVTLRSGRGANALFTYLIHGEIQFVSWTQPRCLPESEIGPLARISPIALIMTSPTYQAATTVAPTVEAHFARHISKARKSGEEELASPPDIKTVEAIIDATFWAGFRPEEGRFPKISIAYLPPET